MNSSVAIREISRGPNLATVTWIKIGLVAGLVLGLYGEILADLAIEWWTVSSSSYGMLIPPLAGYISDKMGWNALFIASTAMALPGLLVLWRIQNWISLNPDPRTDTGELAEVNPSA